VSSVWSRIVCIFLHSNCIYFLTIAGHDLCKTSEYGPTKHRLLLKQMLLQSIQKHIQLTIFGFTVRRKSSEYKQGLVAYTVPTEDIWTIIMIATFCLLVCSAENRPRNRFKSIFETPYITSIFLLHIHIMLLHDVESHQTSMASPKSPSKICAQAL